MDSYQNFLNHFGIDRRELFEWGINATIFPAVEKVSHEWEELKTRILTNQIVYIRGYGREGHGTQLYKGLYKGPYRLHKKYPTPRLVIRYSGLAGSASIFLRIRLTVTSTVRMSP